MLAKIMLSGANVLLLDGPTNHLDLEAITAVNEGIQRFEGTVLFTSHDHEFVQTIANRIFELDGGRIAADERMSFDEYVAARRPKVEAL
jgi:ATPase subunit of ABC transporter with duplicated ATPase domains